MKILKLYEEFKKSPANVVNKSYIEYKYGKYYIRSIDFKKISIEEFRKTINDRATLNYSSLMRFFWYIWILNYKGDNLEVKEIINTIKDKSDIDNSKYVKILDMIGNNKTVLGMYNRELGLGIRYNKDDNLKTLTNIDFRKNDIFTDDYFIRIFEIIGYLSSEAEKSEKAVKLFLEDLWKDFDISSTDEKADKEGVDLWKINKKSGERVKIQVKNLSKYVTYQKKGYIIEINNTSLDIRNYSKGDKEKYEYLIFYDKYNRYIHIIEMKTIKQIKTSTKLKNIKIHLNEFETNYKLIDKYIIM